MLQIALLVSSLIPWANPSASQGPAPTSAEDQLVVLVLDDVTGEPVANAEVVAYDLAKAQLQWRARGSYPTYFELRAEREQLGVRQLTDAHGRASFARTEGEIALRAQAPGTWAEAMLDGTSQAPLELRLEPDVTLEVAVVEAQGAPVSDMAVGLAERSAEEAPQSASGSTFIQWSQSDGVARFEHAQVILRNREQNRWVAHLAIPLVEPVEVVVDASQPGAGRLRLIAPPTGSFSIECPAIESGRARIRRATDDRLGAWFSWEPLRAPFVEGAARFPHVGLGLEVEYEVSDDKSDNLLHGRIAGPTEVGGRAVLTCPGDENFPRFVGRLVDEDLAPVHDTPVTLTFTRRHKGATYSQGLSFTTDQEGRFDYVLRSERGGIGEDFTIRLHAGQGRESREIALPDELPAGPVELGDIQIVVPGSSRRLGRLEDSALEDEYRQALRAGNGNSRRVIEACLSEMARRGGERWVTFLEAELARERTREDASDVEDLELLTALRRAQGAGDPLVLELEGPSELECTFPASPVVAFRLKNADVQGETFHLTRGGDYRSGRFARCRVEAVDEAGGIIAPLPAPGFMGGGSMQRGPFGKGHSVEFGLALGDYVQWPKPGIYRVRILYHDQTQIDSEADVSGWIMSSSPMFTVRVAPLVIETSRAEQASLAEHIRAIDAGQSVLLVSGHWSRELTFAAEPSTPQDHLFRAGWQSLPALLDALESNALEPRRRGWVLGMLWNITGIHNPPMGAIGSHRWAESWPGASVAGQPSMAEFGEGTGEPHRVPQRELTQRWLDLRSLVEVKLID